jgi:hypothetical protein
MQSRETNLCTYVKLLLRGVGWHIACSQILNTVQRRCGDAETRLKYSIIYRNRLATGTKLKIATGYKMRYRNICPQNLKNLYYTYQNFKARQVYPQKIPFSTGCTGHTRLHGFSNCPCKPREMFPTIQF